MAYYGKGTSNQILTDQTAPTMSKFQLANLASSVTGVLPIANGGTNANTMSTNTGIVTYNGTSLVTSSTNKINSSGLQTNTAQPAVSAYLNTTVSNATGDGTTVVVIWDTLEVNQGNYYSTSTGIFTAPVAGNYFYSVQLGLRGITSSHNNAYLVGQTDGANAQATFFNPYAVYDASNDYSAVSQTGLYNLPAAGTLRFLIIVNGGSKVVSVGGLSVIGEVTTLDIALLS